MCDPLTIGLTTAAVGTASSVMGFEGQRQAYNSNAQMANLSAASNYNALQEQAAQVDAQQSEATVNAVIERAKTQGAISAYAGSFGLGGATTARAENAAAFSAGRQLSVEDATAQNQRLQIGTELTNNELQRQAKINSMPQANALGMVLGIAKAGLSGVSAYGSAKGFGS